MSKSNRPVATLIGFAILCILFSVFMISPGSAQQVEGFDLFAKPIDNAGIRRHFQEVATRIMRKEEGRSVEDVKRMLDDAPPTCPVPVSEFNSTRLNHRSETYQHIVKSTTVVGELYKCGYCEKTHLRFSGGVLISDDGLMLTNYHVIASMDLDKSESVYVMTWEGKLWSIEEILFADRGSDVVLLRLSNSGHKFYSAPLADKAPMPLDSVRVVSHPSNQFFVMTSGEVSRYVRQTKVVSGDQKTRTLRIIGWRSRRPSERGQAAVAFSTKREKWLVWYHGCALWVTRKN